MMFNGLFAFGLSFHLGFNGIVVFASKMETDEREQIG